MEISSISSQKFGAFLVLPPQVNIPPVPAIIKTAESFQTKTSSLKMPKFNLKSIPERQKGSANDMFILHEAILPDTKIRVVGLPAKSSKHDYSHAKLKGPGKRHIMSIWLHK